MNKNYPIMVRILFYIENLNVGIKTRKSKRKRKRKGKKKLGNIVK